jgi:hypothetical protein
MQKQPLAPSKCNRLAKVKEAIFGNILLIFMRSAAGEMSELVSKVPKNFEECREAPELYMKRMWKGRFHR